MRHFIRVPMKKLKEISEELDKYFKDDIRIKTLDFSFMYEIYKCICIESV